MTVPYGVIADCFRNGTVVPFLGAAASFAGATITPLPSARALAERLATMGGYPGEDRDQLGKVTQFLEESSADRQFLLHEIYSTFLRGVPESYECALTKFLAELSLENIPRLMLTTNYDLLVERALSNRNIPFFSFSHILKSANSKYAGRYLCYDSLQAPLNSASVLPLTRLEEKLEEISNSRPRTIVIYKMHGTARIEGTDQNGDPIAFDSVVLTEGDYVDFLAQDIVSKVPALVVDALRIKRILYLGYSLEDWNFRVLLRRLNLRRGDSQRRHWACLLNPNDVESGFWQLRGVTMYEVGLEAFLSKLLATLRGA